MGDMTATPIGAPLQGTNTLLFSLAGANMNVTTDQSLTKAFGFTNYVISLVQFTNASTSLTTAVGGLYPAASKAGTALISAATAYAALTAAGITLSPAITNTAVLTATPILSLTIAQGGAATADVRIFGYALS